MPILTLRKLDETSYGVTIPKDDLRLEGLIDENDELLEEEQVVVDRHDDGEWRVRRLNTETFPQLAD